MATNRPEIPPYWAATGVAEETNIAIAMTVAQTTLTERE